MKKRAPFIIGCRPNQDGLKAQTSWTLFYGAPPPGDTRGQFIAGVVHPRMIEMNVSRSAAFICLLLEIEP